MDTKAQTLDEMIHGDTLDVETMHRDLLAEPGATKESAKAGRDAYAKSKAEDLEWLADQLAERRAYQSREDYLRIRVRAIRKAYSIARF